MKLTSFLTFTLATTGAFGRSYTILYYKKGNCKGTSIGCTKLQPDICCPLPASIPEQIGYYPVKASSDDGIRTEFLGAGLRRPDGTCAPCQAVALMNKCLLGGEGAYIVKDKGQCKMPGREGEEDQKGCQGVREVDTVFVNGTAYAIGDGMRQEIARDAFEMDEAVFLEKHERALVKRGVEQS